MNANFFDGFDEEPQIDLTPLIDCLFMLIIFFVLTMSFSRPVLEIILPEAKNAESSHERNELLLSVRADGTYAINSDAVTLEELSARLDADPDKLLNIYMDEKAPFAAFVKVLDLAKVKRAGRFVISTRDPGESRSSGSDGAAAPESEQHGEQ